MYHLIASPLRDLLAYELVHPFVLLLGGVVGGHEAGDDEGHGWFGFVFWFCFLKFLFGFEIIQLVGNSVRSFLLSRLLLLLKERRVTSLDRGPNPDYDIEGNYSRAKTKEWKVLPTMP